MSEKKTDEENDWELSVGWDHPLVKAGLWPEHLLRQSFGYARTGMYQWCKEHQFLAKKINQRYWFHIDKFMEWAASNDDDLPPMAPAGGPSTNPASPSAKGKKGKPAQRGNN